jgi:hypothetical protein
MKLIRITVIAALLLIIAGGYVYQQLKLEGERVLSEDPRVWEPVIAEFAQRDQENPPPADAIEFIGSSTIRFWDSLGEDMQPLVAFGRGFGGAKIADLVYFTDRLVKPYQPRALVVYIGANDFTELLGNQPKTPEQALRLYRQLVERLKQAAPARPIFILALRPKPKNPAEDQRVSEFNRLLADEAAGDALLYFIDRNEVFFDERGEMDSQYISWDTIHINDRGYQVWGDAIRERLQAELAAMPAAVQ